MAVGKKVISAFSGPADVHSFNMISHVPSSHTIKATKSEERLALESLYQQVRQIREGYDNNGSLKNILHSLKMNHSNDWLLSVEIVEILVARNELVLIEEVLIHLEKLKANRPEIAHLISGGLEVIFEKEEV